MGKTSRFHLNEALGRLCGAGVDVPTYRQVDYWIRTGRVLSDLDGLGTGARRLVTVEELAVLATIQQVKSLGFDLGVAVELATSDNKTHQHSVDGVTLAVTVDFQAQLARIEEALSSRRALVSAA